MFTSVSIRIPQDQSEAPALEQRVAANLNALAPPSSSGFPAGCGGRLR
jgi:hypothetical protein